MLCIEDPVGVRTNVIAGGPGKKLCVGKENGGVCVYHDATVLMIRP